jgi:hypothetical protein
MSTHDLKCWPEWFEPIKSGDKTAELRLNDRDYKVGDILVLREYEPNKDIYTGRVCSRRVTHVVHGCGSVGVIAPLRGLSTKYVMLSLQEISVDDVIEGARGRADREIACDDQS